MGPTLSEATISRNTVKIYMERKSHNFPGERIILSGRLVSLVVISRDATDSNVLNNLSDRWAGVGVLRPTPVDEIPHPWWHMSSLHRQFWPLASLDSSACIKVPSPSKWGDASVYLTHSMLCGQLSIPRHGERLVEATSNLTQANANMSHGGRARNASGTA